MARTQARDFDSKREAIMRKAAGLFAEKGFNGSSLSDLSKSCGVSKSLIYHYYSSKEDILFDVMNRHVEELISTVAEIELDKTNPLDNFSKLTKAILKCYNGAENEQKVLLYELNNLKPNQRKEIVQKQRTIIGIFESVYANIFPELKDTPALLRSKIMLFFGMINWVHTWFNPDGQITRDQLAQLAAETVT